MEEKKQVLTRRKYDADFKQQVLQMIANGRPVREVAESLGIGENLIYRWKQKTKGKEKATYQDDSTSLSVENQQLKERVRQLEAEREILKKALAIFSRQT